MNAHVIQKIKQIIAERKRQLPIIQQKLEYLETLKNKIKVLDTAFIKLSEEPKANISIDEINGLFEINDVLKSIDENIAQFQTVAARLNRNTINIGVSGRARVGKSTLLQTISGLSDNEVPTGEGIPVTAVRSRIFNSPIRRATISFHTYESFRMERLAGLHDKLPTHLSLPRTLEDFRNYKYPTSDELTSTFSGNEGQITEVRSALNDLKEIQEALPSYEHDLNAQDQHIDLSEIRQFVAYPTNEERKSIDCPRRYLAVRDIKIVCNFPNVDVQELGLIDLPGLGETDPNIEKRHVEGFKNDVDFVLVLKNPSKEAFWSDDDENCLRLLEQAKGHLGKSGDFVAITINNRSGNPPELLDGLLEDIKRKVNEGEKDKHYHSFIFNAVDRESVLQNMLLPVLEHIAKELPLLDQEVVNEGFRAAEKLQQSLSRQIANVENDLKNRIPQIAGSDEQRHRLTEKLRKDISTDLQDIVEEMMKEARAYGNFAVEDADFIKNVEDIHQEIGQWITSCFAESQEKWLEEAIKTIKTDKGVSKVALDQFHYIRVEISRRYCGLDPFFNLRISALWEKIAKVFNKQLGNLIPDIMNGKDVLEFLYKKLEEASELSPEMMSAIKELLNLRIAYRDHLHPRVRQNLDTLNYEIRDPQTGKQQIQITDIPINEEGARKLLQQLQELARKASHQVRNALLEESGLVPLVLHAAAEQFEDSFIRGQNIEFEFHRLTRSYRNEIWPDAFEGIDRHNACVANVHRQLHDTRMYLGL